MKTKSMIWAAAPLLLAITVTAAKAAEFTTLASPGSALDAEEAVSESLLWSFAGPPDDSEEPLAGLIADKWGNFYSTTISGGANGQGTVFELIPSYGKSTQWSERVLYSFAGPPDDGANPSATLIADKFGNLYGTTEDGGPDGDGTVFELSPPQGKSTQWSEQVLYKFGATSDDGEEPLAGLIADKSGNLYGTTTEGGANFCFLGPCGTVFELSPPYGKSTQWSERVLYSFGASSDDANTPGYGSLLADQRGNLYGMTIGGGTGSSCLGACGTVFELSPPYGKSTQWSEQVLHSFGTTSDDGITPDAGLIADNEGNLYGTTSGSVEFSGTAFELSPPYGQSTLWREQVLWHFGAVAGDGAIPECGLLADKSGNLYGTTGAGGADGDGTVFELSPPYGKSAQWSERVLWSFAGSPDDGVAPAFGTLLADKSGDLYGTTSAGGADGDGTVFELSLPY